MSTSWSSDNSFSDEASTPLTSMKSLEINDRLLTLPSDVIFVIFEYLDDDALSRITRVSKIYKNFEEFTELIFRQRSDFKEILPLTFPEKSSWKHSYLLRKGFWNLIINYREHCYQSIDNVERKKLERFSNYCRSFGFIVSDLVDFVLKKSSQDSKCVLLQEVEFKNDSEVYLNYLKKFNKNLIEVLSNQNLMGLEVNTTLRIWGISPKMLNSDIEKFFYLESEPLEDDSSFSCYKILYQKCPNLFKSISQKATLDNEKTSFIYDLIEAKCENYVTALDFYRRATKNNCSVAQYNIGLMYQQGHGLIQNYKKSFAWLDKSAD